MSKADRPNTDTENYKSPDLPITDTAGQFRITRRNFVKGTAAGALGFAWFGVFPSRLFARFQLPKAQPASSWWFVHGSDSHTNTTTETDSMAIFLDDVHQAFPRAEFVIDTGDVTDHGWEEELDRNRRSLEAFDKPVYAVMGNHDARWSRSGRRAFRERYGATHWVIERDNLAVILIDGAVLLEQYGHIDPSELAWLAIRLKKLNGKPAMIGFHHPPCEADQFLDSDHALFRLLSRHNVPAILAGHIHTRKEYQVNGIEIVTSGAVVSPQAVYCAWEITPEDAVLYKRDPVRNEIRKVLSIPLNARQRGVDLGPLPELKARPGSTLGSLWFRVAAVHYEAIAAFRARGEVAAMLGVGLVLPVKLAAATAVVFPGAAWWLWVAAAMAAYLVQFGDLAGPILQLLGTT